MNRLLLISVVAIELGCAKASHPDTKFTAWNGNWTDAEYKHDGSEPPPEHFEELVTTFDGSKFVRKSHGRVVNEGNLAVLADKEPIWFDGVATGPDGKNTYYKGILCLEGDELILCFDPVGLKRPNKFESRRGSGLILLKLQRLR